MFEVQNFLLVKFVRMVRGRLKVVKEIVFVEDDVIGDVEMIDDEFMGVDFEYY